MPRKILLVHAEEGIREEPPFKTTGAGAELEEARHVGEGMLWRQRCRELVHEGLDALGRGLDLIGGELAQFGILGGEQAVELGERVLRFFEFLEGRGDVGELAYAPGCLSVEGVGEGFG
jgi:hypothetical protein